MTATPNARLVSCSWLEDLRGQVVALGSILVLLLLVALSGCQAAAVAAYTLKGPDPVDAQYILKPVPTVIMVENFQDPAAMADAEQVAQYIQLDIKTAEKEAKKPIVPLIDYRKIYDLRSLNGIKYQKLKISEVGQQVGAKQVIYVELLSSQVQQMVGSDMLRGGASARVKVVDCTTGLELWPEEAAAGFPIGFETTFQRAENGINPQSVREQVLSSLGTSIGRLFHTWKPAE